MELSGRVAVVTGAAGGIGRALCVALARKGTDVVVADVDARRAAETVRSVEALGRRALAVTVDVRDPVSVAELLTRTLDQLGACDLIFNNAGVFHARSLLDTSTSEWRRVLETNLWGVIHGSREFGRHFRAQGHGHIVNVSSAAGLFPSPGMGPYSTSKFAVVGFSLQLRWELAQAGVGVTVACPGTTKTGIGKAAGVEMAHDKVDAIMANAPPPEALARRVLDAVERNRALVRYGPDAFVMSLLRVLPLWLVDPLGRWIGRTALAFLAQPSSDKS